ncbi:electron transport complex subunit RsxG [Craterilacuibacter sp.]|uniref:electron transport complex subunit RsxG n=1 Tax=Craterilacuibacter sp. TaxID=2870909 RepID=UPI003F3AA143
MRNAARQAKRSALTLLVFALVTTAVLALTYALTRDTVRANEDAARTALMAQTLPEGSFDNSLIASPVALDTASRHTLGLADDANAYLARRQGQPVAVVFETVAPNGYGGKIRLLVGMLANGKVSGVRVIAHKETPGLGDYIDSAKSRWSEQFAGKDTHARWKVKKDGGDFDYISGATISARAVTAAVGRVATLFNAQRQQYLAQP